MFASKYMFIIAMFRMATEQPAQAPNKEPGPNEKDEAPNPEDIYDSRRSNFLKAIDRADVIEIAEQLCLGVHVGCVQTLTGNTYVFEFAFGMTVP